MMTLDDAVDLVLHAFQKGANGDLFVQKSPAATIETLARALIEMYGSKVKIKIIGTRHGEKIHETLVNREEMVKAVDQDHFFRIPADTRDLNYNKYFSEGQSRVSFIKEYNSSNTRRLNVKETMQMLLRLDFIRQDLIPDEKKRTFEYNYHG